MAKRARTPRYAAGIVERPDNHILIATSEGSAATERLWHFPRGAVAPDESPEAAIRRIAEDELGLTIEIVVGQPPLRCRIDGKEAELRYFFCGIITGEARSSSTAELRWVSRAHLREYDFDAPSQPVVGWLLETGG